MAGESQKRGRDEEGGGGGGGGEEKRWAGWPGETVFRLVVPAQKVGSIIGRRGELIKKACEESKARIKVFDGPPSDPDRVVMVSAKEEPEAEISPAMSGLLKVSRRILEGGSEGAGMNPTGNPNGMMVSCRLLVAGTQAGSLIGKQGSTIKSIQDTSGATVRVLSEDLPLCSLSDDKVVEIRGEMAKVFSALELVTSHLRKFLVDRSILPMFEATRASKTRNQESTLETSWGAGHTAASMIPNSLGGSSHYTPSALQHDSYYQPSDLLDSHGYHHGVSMYGRDLGVGGLNTGVSSLPPAPVITQVTQHMQVPLSYADAIIGTAGSNISYARRSSGATITIQETRGVAGEMTVEIHGTASEVQVAQQLIQSFMVGESPAPSSYAAADTYSSYAPSSLYSSGPTHGQATTVYGSLYNSNNIY